MKTTIRAFYLCNAYYYFELPCKHFKKKRLTGSAFLADGNQKVPHLPLCFYKPVGNNKNTVIVKAPYLGDKQHVRIEILYKEKQQTIDQDVERAQTQECHGDAASFKRLEDIAKDPTQLEALYPESYFIAASRYCPLGATIAVCNKNPLIQSQDCELCFFNTDGSRLESKKHRIHTILGETITTSFNLWDIELPSTSDLVIINSADTGATGTIVQNARSLLDHLFVSRMDAYGAPYAYENKDLSKPNHLPRFAETPLFSIVVPLFNTPATFFTEMADSVLNQSFKNYELILVNASANNKELNSLINKTLEADARVRVVPLPHNLGITENTNAGIEVAQGEFLCFLDHDDVLDKDALGCYARALNLDSNIDLFYCDEDMLEDGVLSRPLYKPDFNLDLLRSKNYIIHFLAIRKELFMQMPRPSSEFDGAQDYNATLFAAEHARNICHIQKPLYHWRIHNESTAVNPDAKPYAENAGRIAVQRHLDRTAKGAIARTTEIQNIYTVDYPLPIEFSLSIITVSGGKALNADWLRGYEVVCAHDFSSISLNQAANKAHGSYLLFLDIDDTVCTPTMISSLVALCARNDVGAVGMKVIDDSGVIESNGYALPFDRVLPLFQDLEVDDPGYLFHSQTRQNVSATSIHGLLTPRSLFEAIGGFSEHPSDLGIPYCKAVKGRNYLVVQEPSAVIRCNTFKRANISKTDEKYGFPDPFFNENFDSSSPQFKLKNVALGQ